MNLVLDLLLIVVIVLVAVRTRSRSVKTTLFQLGKLVAATLIALLLSLGISSTNLKDLFFANRFASEAAGEMADMVSVAKFENGYETIRSVDVERLLRENSEGMKELLEQYNVKKSQITGENEIGEKKNQVMLRQIVDPAATDLTKAVSFLVLFLIFDIILFMVLRFLLGKKAIYATARKNKTACLLLGIGAGIFVAWFVYSTVIGLAAPYNVGFLRMLDLKGGLENSLLTKFFCKINFLL